MHQFLHTRNALRRHRTAEDGSSFEEIELPPIDDFFDPYLPPRVVDRNWGPLHGSVVRENIESARRSPPWNVWEERISRTRNIQDDDAVTVVPETSREETTTAQTSRSSIPHNLSSLDLPNLDGDLQSHSGIHERRRLSYPPSWRQHSDIPELPTPPASGEDRSSYTDPAPEWDQPSTRFYPFPSYRQYQSRHGNEDRLSSANPSSMAGAPPSTRPMTLPALSTISQASGSSESFSPSRLWLTSSSQNGSRASDPLSWTVPRSLQRTNSIRRRRTSHNLSGEVRAMADSEPVPPVSNDFDRFTSIRRSRDRARRVGEGWRDRDVVDVSLDTDFGHSMTSHPEPNTTMVPPRLGRDISPDRVPFLRRTTTSTSEPRRGSERNSSRSDVPRRLTSAERAQEASSRSLNSDQVAALLALGASASSRSGAEVTDVEVDEGGVRVLDGVRWVVYDDAF
ncbi:hypothetical protein BT69DRAFT_766643 [Atractiella rhizophila]|nr:hypothetical protein BT69DRAFT_766643 [Atractiella rhizophila]